MKTRKFLAFIITIAMLVSTIFTFNTLANNNIDLDGAEPMPMPTVPVLPEGHQEPQYAVINGKIESIEERKMPNGDTSFTAKTAITITSGAGDEKSVWVVFVDDTTFFIKGGKTDLKVGASIRAFYNSNAPMTMIYPPQVNADYVAVGLDESKSVTIDRFDDKLTDLKNTLKLNIPKDFNKKGTIDKTDKTEIVYEDGKKFEGDIAELTNRKLVVIYSVSTRSIPAQTTPEKIIIMFEKAVNPSYLYTDEENGSTAKSFETAVITVNGKAIKAPGAYMTSDGFVMVPVRAIAEALDLTVIWFGDTKTVQIGKSLSCTIGKDAYAYNRMAPVQLGTAPVIKNDSTFVPIEFFTINAIDGIEVGVYYGSDDGNAVINVESK